MEDVYPYVVFRLQGMRYRIERSPFESHERTMDRGWYIVKQKPTSVMDFARAEAESHRWANEKYYGMQYV